MVAASEDLDGFLYLWPPVFGAARDDIDIGSDFRMRRTVGVAAQYGQAAIGIAAHDLVKRLAHRAARKVRKPLVIELHTAVEAGLWKGRYVRHKDHLLVAVQSTGEEVTDVTGAFKAEITQER